MPVDEAGLFQSDTAKIETPIVDALAFPVPSPRRWITLVLFGGGFLRFKGTPEIHHHHRHDQKPDDVAAVPNSAACPIVPRMAIRGKLRATPPTLPPSTTPASARDVTRGGAI